MSDKSSNVEQYNCAKCTSIDNNRMVQCDKCDQWYHFKCVEVGDDIANYSWSCDVCVNAGVPATTSIVSPPTATQSVMTTKPSASQSDIVYVSTPRRHAPQVKYTILDIDAVKSSNIHQQSDRMPDIGNVTAAGNQCTAATMNLHNVAIVAETPYTAAAVSTPYTMTGANMLQLIAALNNPYTAAAYGYMNPPATANNVHAAAAAYNQHAAATTTANYMPTATGTQHISAAATTQQYMTNVSSINGVCSQQPIYTRCFPYATGIQPSNNMFNTQQLNSNTNQQHYVGRNNAYLPAHAVSMQHGANNHSNMNCNGMDISNWSFTSEVPTPMQIAARQVIPKDLPKFHGDPEEWPLFINCFENSTKVAGYTNAENLIRLQACLKGKALEMVRSRLMLPALVPEVLQTLRMRFGRPEVIIENLLEKVRKSPPVRERLEGLIDLALCVRNICATMEACDLHACMHNPMIIKEILEKIPNQYKINWAMHPKNNLDPVLKVFSDWLYALAEAASQVVPATPCKSNGVVNAHYQEQEVENEQTAKLCSYCKNNNHFISECQGFKKLSADSRWTAVRELSLCRQCLKQHKRKCFSKKLCGTEGCIYKHHPLLHKQPNASNKFRGTTNDRGSYNQTVNCHSSRDLDHFFRIIPVTVRNKNKILKTYAFLDEGSSVTLMDKTLFDNLELEGVNDPLCLTWTSNQKRNEDDSIRTSLHIGKVNSRRYFGLRDVRTVADLGMPMQSLPINELTDKFPHLKSLPIEGYKNVKPTILIGSDNWNLAIALKVKEGAWNEPIATKTRLGWTIQGGNADNSANYLNVHKCGCEADFNELHQLVKMQFQMEKPAQAALMSKEDQRAMDILKQTCHRVDNRFQTGLLWKSERPDLPNSFDTAYKRMMCLQRKFKKDPQLQATIQGKIDNLIKKKYAVKLCHTSTKEAKYKWYLPIFVTLNPNKPGKIRLVWDAAAKTGGVSLNDFMLTGPDLLNSLVEVLLGFRTGRIAIAGDIEEMFHQIAVRPEDANVQRFLWCSENEERPSEYVMQVLSFGITCAPCIAHYVRNANAEDFREEYPEAVDAIQKAHYMDDYIDSSANEEKMIELAKRVKQIHAAAGFNIRNWASNSKLVLAEMGDSTTQNSVNLGDSEKVLGIYWDPEQDLFKYEFKFARLKRPILTEQMNPTKREMLQVVMSLFDPLGLLSLYTAPLKILLQDVWRSGIDWDHQLPENLLKKWYHWRETMKIISTFKIPRCVATNLFEADDVQLHTFVDAGELAYAATTYLRVQTSNNVEVLLVMAKSKVAPLKATSIPRLELQAALIGTRLASQVSKVDRIRINKQFFWTDSLTVLKWLHMDPRNLKQFVMFRIAEIIETTEASEWRWVPSKLNPADLATKIHNKPNEELWTYGPPYLKLPMEDWPAQKESGPTEIPEMRTHVVAVHTNNKSLQMRIEKFSCWKKLYRAVATFLLYFKRLKAKISGLTLPTEIDHELIIAAKYLLIRQAQKSEFIKEISCLRAGKNIERSSPLVGFSAYLDDHDILRVKGRAEGLTTCDAIVLPHHHYLTLLIVDNIHRKFHHVSHETTVNEVKGKYHISGLRVLYKRVRKSCQTCKNKEAVPRPPQMASLPKARLAAFERPFTYVGIDYFGPILVTVGRRSEKRWGAIFTCLTIRAIHIEVAHSLDTASCIMCLRNFMSRRGVPKEIYTDNGTNFKATANLVNCSAIDYKEVFAKYDEIKWRFNPPAAPHMGGAWERLVRSVKEVLKCIQPTYKFNDETLRSALLEVEFIVNSRPLTFVSVDNSDDEALTPNHLLLGSAAGFKPIGNPAHTLKHKYRMTEAYADQFWRRWVKEYAPIIARRSKWFNKQDPLKEGDLVMVVDENFPRNAWPKGVIIGITTASDGQVRRATVKTASTIMERPAAKLAKLDVGIEGCNQTQ